MSVIKAFPNRDTGANLVVKISSCLRSFFVLRSKNFSYGLMSFTLSTVLNSSIASAIFLSSFCNFSWQVRDQVLIIARCQPPTTIAILPPIDNTRKSFFVYGS